MGRVACSPACCLKVPLTQGTRSQNPQQKAEGAHELGLREQKPQGREEGSLLFSVSSDRVSSETSFMHTFGSRNGVPLITRRFAGPWEYKRPEAAPTFLV